MWAYLSSQLQRQADTFRELLFDCERDFRTVYQEFDQSGLIRTAGEVIAHSRIRALAEEMWASRDKTADELGELLETYDMDLRFAVFQAVAVGSDKDADYGRGFRLALYKLRPRYPVLHMFLLQIYSIMTQTVAAMRSPETYLTLITGGLRGLKEQGDLEKMASPESILSHVYGIILVNMSRAVKDQRINDVLESLSKLMDIFQTHYRDRSDFSLWLLSRSESASQALASDKDTYGATFKTLIDFKRKRLSQQAYGEASQLTGELHAIMQESQSKTEAKQ